MGTRGSLGGLSKKTADVVKLMDAFGMDLVIIETVGVGQSRSRYRKNADTTLVVLVPGLGDDIKLSRRVFLRNWRCICYQ